MTHTPEGDRTCDQCAGINLRKKEGNGAVEVRVVCQRDTCRHASKYRHISVIRPRLKMMQSNRTPLLKCTEMGRKNAWPQLKKVQA
ncbi:hypothetical protein [Herbaspirillum rhizosphaerae]|uniref:hypothetical protein n=1 Tax=Herbaspirillum rhizosphaerae TaxID=346179 RepID=UPI0012ED6978|nr:hypothetical protein [Herbaspirillum rhizosphaerae]